MTMIKLNWHEDETNKCISYVMNIISLLHVHVGYSQTSICICWFHICVESSTHSYPSLFLLGLYILFNTSSSSFVVPSETAKWHEEQNIIFCIVMLFQKKLMCISLYCVQSYVSASFENTMQFCMNNLFTDILYISVQFIHIWSCVRFEILSSYWTCRSSGICCHCE